MDLRFTLLALIRIAFHETLLLQNLSPDCKKEIASSFCKVDDQDLDKKLNKKKKIQEKEDAPRQEGAHQGKKKKNQLFQMNAKLETFVSVNMDVAMSWRCIITLNVLWTS